ncbi:MAG: MerR family transcriptional regulator [Gammaproteobacteria bacterium]
MSVRSTGGEAAGTPLLTIGELAKRASVSTSLLRYYEKEALLKPSGRTESGYRLYAPAAERTLRFIRSAQRYGFSLHDIKLILGATSDGGESETDIRELAEQRFMDIERRVTEMLVLRHELELFLDDVAIHLDRSVGESAGEQYRALLETACGHDHALGRSTSLHKLIERIGCKLADAESDSLLKDLRGRHIHIWRDDDGYSVLFADPDPALETALNRLVAAEADCEAHLEPELSVADGGLVFRARGNNAFLFAQLFLALEASEA